MKSPSGATGLLSFTRAIVRAADQVAPPSTDRADAMCDAPPGMMKTATRTPGRGTASTTPRTPTRADRLAMTRGADHVAPPSSVRANRPVPKLRVHAAYATPGRVGSAVTL